MANLLNTTINGTLDVSGLTNISKVSISSTMIDFTSCGTETSERTELSEMTYYIKLPAFDPYYANSTDGSQCQSVIKFLANSSPSNGYSSVNFFDKVDISDDGNEYI